MNRRNLLCVLLAVLVLLNAALTVFLCAKVYSDRNTGSAIKYTFFIGLNDKDTLRQEIPVEDAKKIVEEVCSRYVSGYTLQDATGSWIDEKGQVGYEKTIVCIFYDTDEDTIHEMAGELRIKLNQNSILIEKNEVEDEFYNGK